MIRPGRRPLGALFSILAVLLAAPLPSLAQGPPPFDPNTGNAAFVIIPTVIPKIYESVSPTASDATLVLRVTTLITNSWFDAIAPYRPTAVGVYSDLGRRPAAESSDYNKNVAMLYASYRVLNSLLPQHEATWRGMLASVGLDPDDDSVDLTTPVGIGNAAGFGVVAAREHDGMNQTGEEGGCAYNCLPYSDTLGYRPVNTAYALVDASRWQPGIVTGGNGVFRTQQFVTPQMSVTLPYSYDHPGLFQAPPPLKSQLKGAGGKHAYRLQADEVLAVSASLTDRQKMTAELFDNKLESLGFSALFILLSRNLSIDQFVDYDYLTNMAAFDTAIAIWNEKIRWDAVRPFSAIRYLYGDGFVAAWGGPGMGSVSDIPASQWRGYLEVADHPEYPSGSASFCAAHAQASRLYLGSDAFGWEVLRPAGSSRIEPGLTPASDVVLSWDTWTAFEEECGLSRLWGGVHFYDSIPAGAAIGRQIGTLAYEFLQNHVSGNVD